MGKFLPGPTLYPLDQSAVEPPSSRFRAFSIPSAFITLADSATVTPWTTPIYTVFPRFDTKLLFPLLPFFGSSSPPKTTFPSAGEPPVMCGERRASRRSYICLVSMCPNPPWRSTCLHAGAGRRPRRGARFSTTTSTRSPRAISSSSLPPPFIYFGAS